MTQFDYWYMGFIGAATAFLCIVFVVVHSHVWVRNGYMGLNGVLELPEVDRFVAHIISEAGLVCFFLMCMLEPLVRKYIGFEFGYDSKIGMLSFSVGAGLYVALKKKLKLTENDNRQTQA